MFRRFLQSGASFSGVAGSSRRMLIQNSRILAVGLGAGFLTFQTMRREDSIAFFDQKAQYVKGSYFEQGICPAESVLKQEKVAIIDQVIRDNVIIVSGSGNKKLSEEVSAFLGVKLVDIKTGNFKDGETFLKYDDDITNKDVVLICSLGKPANDTTMEALMLVSSLKRQGAKTVTLIQPYSSYARQDVMVGPYRSLAFSDLAHFLESCGLDRIITLDLHNPAALGAYSGKTHADNLSAVALGAEFISKKFVSDAVVLTPDAGGLKRAKSFYEYYHNFNNLSSFAIMLKYRSRPNEVGSVNLLGDISGKDCIIVDDMIDTGSTLMKSATELKEKGAKRVYAFATHGIFSGDFYANLAKSDLEQIFVTDSLAPREEDAGSKVRRVSVSKLLADKIFDIFGK